jgi:hypothetical protein
MSGRDSGTPTLLHHPFGGGCPLRWFGYGLVVCVAVEQHIITGQADFELQSAVLARGWLLLLNTIVSGQSDFGLQSARHFHIPMSTSMTNMC